MVPFDAALAMPPRRGFRGSEFRDASPATASGWVPDDDQDRVVPVVRPGRQSSVRSRGEAAVCGQAQEVIRAPLRRRHRLVGGDSEEPPPDGQRGPRRPRIGRRVVGLARAHEAGRVLTGDHADGRFLPWGDRSDGAFCNSVAAYSDRPCNPFIGLFPADESPFGVRDGAGIVHNWTSSEMLPYTRARVMRITKGGSWMRSSTGSRAAGSDARHEEGAAVMGLRLVATIP